MDKLLKGKESMLLKTYLEKLCDYCNKYDNIAILNQVKAFVGEENIALSDVYADFELVSKDEYDRGNGKKGFFASNSARGEFDIGAILRKIDKKIYELEVEEAIGKKENSVTKKSLYINVKDIDGNCVECLIKGKPEDTEIITKKIKIVNINDTEYINKIKEHWVWVRGYEVVAPDDSFYLLEPHWYKNNEELTEQDKDFFESDLVIEEEYNKDEDKLQETAKNLLNMNEKQGEGIEKTLDKGEEAYEINGMVILSEPGGGKTTYLKHLIYEIISYYKSNIAGNQVFEKNGLDKNVLYIPFFVRTRDLTDILNDEKIKKESIFDVIIESSVSNIISTKKDKDSIYVKEVISSLFQNRVDYRKLFIIDGFEELDDEKAGKLLECINYSYDSGKLDRKEDRLIISSRYKEYGYQKLVKFCAEHAIEEKYIKFDNKSSAIDICVSKWFDILRKTGQDNHDYFNQMRTSNSDISKLITTPLELTGLIMLCQSQSALPTDMTVLYRSIIEIWLTYGIKDAVIPFFSLSDIFLELATIAYYMAESENEKLRISRDKIKEIIEKRREDLRRYYRSNSYVSASSKEEIDALINFWLKRNIFVKNSNEDIYEFAHREYQSYLISYAIVNNFIPKDKRKSERIKYFEEHMEQAEDFWDRVIIFSAFMSTDFHDDIIEYILKRLQTLDMQDVKASPLTDKSIDKYFLSIILQLANAEGFYFADDEYERLFEELFKNDRINIMKKSVKGSEIKKLLSNGRKDTNTLFLKKSIEVIEKCNEDIERLKRDGSDVELLDLRKKEKNNIIDIMGNIVFHVTWNCDADRDTIKKAFGLYLDNWITMEMIYEIKDSLDSYRYNLDRINLIKEIGLEAITRKNQPLSDCYMIISIILGFSKDYQDDDLSLYGVALNYFNKAESSVNETEKLESIIIAINIVFLTTWFLQGKDAIKFNCALKDDEGNWNLKLLEEYSMCIVKIIEYMKIVKGDRVYSRDLYASYRDLFLSKPEDLREKTLPLLYDREVFRNCLLICENERIVKESDETELSYVFEIISLYPLEYMNFSEVKSILGKRVDDIEICRKSDKMTSRKAIYLLKLLIFAGAFDDNGRINAMKLKAEIDGLRETYTRISNNSDRFILDSMEDYMRHNLRDYRLNYKELMSIMDKKINEL